MNPPVLSLRDYRGAERRMQGDGEGSTPREEERGCRQIAQAREEVGRSNYGALPGRSQAASPSSPAREEVAGGLETAATLGRR